MFKGLRKSVTEKANEQLGKARLAAQRKQFKEASDFAEQAIEILKGEEDRRKLDLARALYYEYLGNLSIKENKALESANYLGRSGGFYLRLSMDSELQRVHEKQAKILLVIARQVMKEKKFVEAASFFERAAISFQRIGNTAEELDCKAKSYISRAAAEKTISGRKGFLKKAVELIGEKGSDEPIIKAHLAYYNGLFIEDEKTELALKYYTEALQNYQLSGVVGRVEEIKKKIDRLTKLL